jgi:hypothetical protein
MPEPISVNLGMYIMPPEAISATYFKNLSHLYTNSAASETVEVKS